MMYTVRFAHLEEVPKHKSGDIIRRGELIGLMGATGSGSGAHLHLDVVDGLQTARYTLNDIEYGNKTSSPKQAILFVDKELFDIEPVITTPYADPLYYSSYKKVHSGFDLVPMDRHKNKDHYKIRWNRSMPGRVTNVLVNDPGYGNCLMVVFEA